VQSNNNAFSHNLLYVAVVTGLLALAPLSSAVAAPLTGKIQTEAQAQAVKTWRDQVKKLGAPSEGCFRVTYPSTIFEKHACGTGTTYVATPRSAAKHALAAGNTGNDYYAQAAKPIQSATGSFPAVTGVTSVTSVYPNNEGSSSGEYTLQLNTNMAEGSAALCKADGQQSGCYVWEQFVYGTNQGNNNQPTVLIQTWLFPANPADETASEVDNMTCPSGWTLSTEGGGCYHNAVSTQTVPLIAASDLANATLEGAVDGKGNDTGYLTFIDSSTGKPTTEVVSQSDTVADFAANWNGAEFNVVGDGGGSNANFNGGSSITVKLAVDDGSNSAPTCAGGPSGGQFSGATGEGNNLNLGTCSATAGTTSASPYVEFTESNSSSSGWGF
jgi:hypothetical protein